MASYLTPFRDVFSSNQTEFHSADLQDNSNLSVTAWQIPSILTSWWTILFAIAVSPYLVDLAAKVNRDRKLREYGSAPPIVPFKLPFGVEIGLHAVYRFYHNTFFELMTKWITSVPGRTIEMRMFAQGIVFTDEPANIKALMSTEFNSFGKGEVTRRIWRQMLGDTQIFTIDGPHWHTKKDMLRPHVAKLRSNDLEITEKHVQRLFKVFSERPVEVYDYIDRYQLDVTTDVFFGESANSIISKPPFREPMEKLSYINTVRMLFGWNAMLSPDSLLAPRSLLELNDYVKGVTDRAYARDLSKKSTDEYNMLDDLVSQNRSRQDIKEAMMSIMLGGKDPSSILISWALYEMSLNPSIMHKMQAEIQAVCGTQPPTAAQLKELVYIRDVINETFRLHHPLGINIRVAFNHATLPTGGGKSGKEPLAIQKGSTVMYSLQGLQMRRDIWGEDAHIFRPERWQETKVHRWHFIPYNHGPRTCMGRLFGQQQMEYVLARICQEFEKVSLLPGQKKQQIKVELNLKMAHPAVCEFVPKKKL